LPFGRYGAQCVSSLLGLVTLTFDLLTLKLVRQSHLKWEIFLRNLDTLGFWFLKLFSMYATDGRTDRRTGGQKQRVLPSWDLSYGWWGHNNTENRARFLCDNENCY